MCETLQKTCEPCSPLKDIHLLHVYIWKTEKRVLCQQPFYSLHRQRWWWTSSTHVCVPEEPLHSRWVCVCVCVRVGLVEREGKAEILTGSKTAALCQRCRVFLPRAWEPSERERERDVTHTHTHTHTALRKVFTLTDFCDLLTCLHIWPNFWPLTIRCATYEFALQCWNVFTRTIFHQLTKENEKKSM